MAVITNNFGNYTLLIFGIFRTFFLTGTFFFGEKPDETFNNSTTTTNFDNEMKEKLKTINKLRKEIKEIQKEIDKELKNFNRTKFTTIHKKENRQSKEKLGKLRKKVEENKKEIREIYKTTIENLTEKIEKDRDTTNKMAEGGKDTTESSSIVDLVGTPPANERDLNKTNEENQHKIKMLEAQLREKEVIYAREMEERNKFYQNRVREADELRNKETAPQLENMDNRGIDIPIFFLFDFLRVIVAF